MKKNFCILFAIVITLFSTSCGKIHLKTDVTKSGVKINIKVDELKIEGDDIGNDAKRADYVSENFITIVENKDTEKLQAWLSDILILSPEDYEKLYNFFGGEIIDNGDSRSGSGQESWRDGECAYWSIQSVMQNVKTADDTFELYINETVINPEHPERQGLTRIYIENSKGEKLIFNNIETP